MLFRESHPQSRVSERTPHRRKETFGNIPMRSMGSRKSCLQEARHYEFDRESEQRNRYPLANVKRWQAGRGVQLWGVAAIVEVAKKFCRVQGWRDIEKLIRALEAREQKAILKRVF